MRGTLQIRRRRGATQALALLLAVALVPDRAEAWIYPEHRDIMAEALKGLPLEQREFFGTLWTEARSGHESRYCQEMVSGDGRTAPSCLDLAAWPAIAGDHSCSPDKLLAETLPSDWILNVGSVAAKTKVGLEQATSRDATLNVWAYSNLALQSADPQYLTRAQANNGHFLLPRDRNTLDEYLTSVLADGVEPNALGLYLYYHLGAVGLARQWAAATEPATRASLARQVLATEAFAIHFLEDSFSAGHIVGIWGSAAERKGTHDYYCEFGLDGMSWSGTPMVMLGDAHMRPQDLTRAAAVVALSLGQLFEAARPGSPAAEAAATIAPEALKGATAYDSCTATRQATATVTATTLPVAKPVAEKTPIPSRGQNEVHVPHFRQEIGPFVGFSGDLTGGLAFGGYQSGNADARWYGGAEIEFRVGVGLEALTGSTGAGQAFLGVGYSYDTPQDGPSGSNFAAAGVPIVPARHGITVRLRVPFYVIPFDLLIVAPVLIWASPTTLTDMGIWAASGGLLRYERAFNTPIGAFQLLLGREAAATFYGYAGDRVDNIGVAAPGATVPYNSDLVFLSYRVLSLDFPTFEYRPLREYSTNQALTFAIQFGWGVELPNQVQYVSKLTLPAATGPTPELAPSWMIYMRIHFDARYYF
ncbi:MAG: hypothetical protein ACLPJH_00860 [Myxococcaceae bacterium]